MTHRLGIKDSLNLEEQTIYYSSWHYSAIHIALTIPSVDTKEAIANYIGLSPRKVAACLSFLVSTGLAQNSGGKFSTRQPSVALTSESPNLPKHHANWRLKAIDSFDIQNKLNLHYTAVVSASRDDIARIKADTLGSLMGQRQIISESKEEDLFCYCIDIFQLGNGPTNER